VTDHLNSKTRLKPGIATTYLPVRIGASMAHIDSQ
jgi:hypothetical protein